MKEDCIVLELPMSPSVNCLFAGKVRRHKSDKYKQWILDSDKVFNKIGTKYKITGNNWLEVHLNYFFSLYTKEGKKRIKDASNYEKATIDYLANKIEGFEDHRIKRIIQEKHDSDKNICRILIKEIGVNN